MITAAAIKKAGAGGIMLFHIGIENTAAALERVLATLEREGYTFVTVDQLVLKDNYTIDHTGKQIKKTNT